MVLASRWAIERFGDSGLATLLALIGLYDVDSGIITVGNLPSGALSPHMAGLLLMLPVIVNTVLKGVIAIVFAGPSCGVSRLEENKSEIQSLIHQSYDGFCLTKKQNKIHT